MACVAVAAVLEEYAGDEHGIPAALLRRTRERCGCAECAEVYTIGQVRLVIERMLEVEVAEPPSPEGFRLALARLGLLGKRAIDEWRQHEISELQHIERALLTWVRARLSPLQLAIVRLTYDPIGWKQDQWFVGLRELEPLMVPLGEDDGQDASGRALLCGAPLKSGGSCRNRREGGQARCKRHHDAHSRPATWVTKREGAEMVHLTTDGRAALVRGRRAEHRNPDQVGAEVGLTGRAVRSQLCAVYEVVRCLPHVGLLVNHG